MYNSELQREQELRVAQEAAREENYIDAITDAFYEGQWDGAIGEKPQTTDERYWRGYITGLRLYWREMLKEEFTEEF